MTELTEQQLATALKEAVPEPAPSHGRAASTRTLADRIRRRRWATASSVAAVLAVAVPVTVLSADTGNDAGPTPPAANSSGPTTAPSTSDGCDARCEQVSVRRAIQRPLRLPSVGAGEACPVSPTRTFPGGAGFSSEFEALGAGPLYLASSPTIRLRPDSSRWRWEKVIWVVGRDYAGPLLLRGARIDASGKLRFAHYIGAVGYPASGGPGDGKPHASLLYLRNGLDAQGPRTLDSYPSGIYAKASGCYAIQVDGEDFTETLVFRATVLR